MDGERGNNALTLNIPHIPTYLSHSYRATDRDLNQFIHNVFWENGFAFTVDPKSGLLSTTHLEMMMKRSACFVGVITRRAEQPTYLCSPFAVYEYGLAVQAHKPRLLIIESGVPRRCFPDSEHQVLFDRRRLDSLDLSDKIKHLTMESQAHRNIGIRPLGEVGLLLPRTTEYAQAEPIIGQALVEAGYTPVSLSFDTMDGAAAAQKVDSMDFVVVDVTSDAPVDLYIRFVHGRFVPTLKLVYHQPAASRPTELPRLLFDEALGAASATSEVAIWWSSLEELKDALKSRIQRLHDPRREFLTKAEGDAYFRSLGEVRGPVFISNAKADNELARAVIDLMRSYNITPFHYLYSNTIDLGAPWPASLPDKVRTSTVFVPLISRDYWESDWCRHEYEQAKEADGVRVIPFFLDSYADLVVPFQGVPLAEVPVDQRAQRVVATLDEYLIGAARTQRAPAETAPVKATLPDVDIAVVTVLQEEYDAMYAHLEDPVPVPGSRLAPNQHSWVTGWITSEREQKYQVVLGLGTSGNEKTALTTRSLVDTFRPEYVLLVGIAGGIDEQLEPGDVVVSDRVCGYDYGKIDRRFIPRPDWSYPANQSVASAARAIATRMPLWHEAIQVPPPSKNSRPPQVLVGQIASGNKVVDNLDEPSFRAVMRQWPKLIAVEMEGLGSVLAVDDARERGLPTYFSMIRGISDLPLRRDSALARRRRFGRPQTQQRDLWKRRAAAAAAALVARLIQTAWPAPPQSKSDGRPR